MRSLWLSVSLLLAIALFTTLGVVFMENSIEEMERSLAVLEKAESTDTVKGDLAHLEDTFYKSRTLLSVLLPMGDIDAMENALILLRHAVQTGDKAAFTSGLSALEFALYLIRDAAVPSFETVF